ncbi:SMP-30/gluconolactonase/LRE family protein, partial [Mesorhizobium sp. M1A.F.Ca.IN.020.32.1.1]
MSADFEVIATDLAFPEGPIFMPDGSIIVVEIASGLVSRIGTDGCKTVIASPGGGPNGAAIGPDGYLYICNSGGFHWEMKNGGEFSTREG